MNGKRLNILVVCLVSFFFTTQSYDEDDLNLADIVQSVEKVHTEFSLDGTEYYKGPDNLYFEGLGDFPLTRKLAHLIPKGPEKVQAKFFLHTGETGDNPVTWQFRESIAEFAKHLLLEEKVYFVCHGFGAKSTSKWVQKIKQEILERENSTVILIDWHKGAKTPDYNVAASNTRMVARITAILLIGMMNVTQDLLLKNVHFIGHSLGAQTGGFFGQDIIDRKNDKVGRITGLDPAGPLFEEYKVYVNRDQAHFVDIIHTSSGGFADIVKGRLGMKAATGHVDFFPNGGSRQPGCSVLKFACSHGRSHDYYVDSINRCVFKAKKCSDFKSYENGLCASPCEAWLCGYMGHDAINATKARGKYYLATSSSEPYCSPSSGSKVPIDKTAIALGAVGGFTAVTIVIIVVLVARRERKKHKKAKTTPSEGSA